MKTDTTNPRTRRKPVLQETLESLVGRHVNLYYVNDPENCVGILRGLRGLRGRADGFYSVYHPKNQGTFYLNQVVEITVNKGVGIYINTSIGL